MSRYQRIEENLSYAWGYDRPLQSYFFQKFDLSAEKEEDECVFSIDSVFSDVPHPDKPEKKSYSNGEMLEIMEQEGVVPEQHLMAIAGDLPF